MDKLKIFKKTGMLIEREIEAGSMMLSLRCVEKIEEKLRRLLLVIKYLGWMEEFDEYIMTFQHLA